MLLFGTSLASERRYLEKVNDGSSKGGPAVPMRYNNRKARRRKPVQDLAEVSEKEVLSSIGTVLVKRKKSQIELQPRVDKDDEEFWNQLGKMSLPNPSPSPVASSPPNGNDNGNDDTNESDNGNNNGNDNGNDNGNGNGSDSLPPVQTPNPTPFPTLAPDPPTLVPTVGPEATTPETSAPTATETTDVYAPVAKVTVPPSAQAIQAPPTEAPLPPTPDRTLAPTTLEDFERPVESAASRSVVLGSSISGALLLALLCFVFVVSCELRRDGP